MPRTSNMTPHLLALHLQKLFQWKQHAIAVCFRCCTRIRSTAERKCKGLVVDVIAKFSGTVITYVDYVFGRSKIALGSGSCRGGALQSGHWRGYHNPITPIAYVIVRTHKSHDRSVPLSFGRIQRPGKIHLYLPVIKRWQTPLPTPFVLGRSPKK